MSTGYRVKARFPGGGGEGGNVGACWTWKVEQNS
jgi:hypothetical protein